MEAINISLWIVCLVSAVMNLFYVTRVLNTLRQINAAALELNTFLHNCTDGEGNVAIEITCATDEIAEMLTDRMNNLFELTCGLKTNE